MTATPELLAATGAEVADGSPAIKVSGAVLRFGGITALDGVDFHVGPDETFGIIGPNGAGKTALLNSISGVYSLTEGTVEMYGEPITGVRPHRIAAKGLGRTFQNMEHFKQFRVLDYVMLGRMHQAPATVVGSLIAWPWRERAERQERARALELLERLGLARYAREELSSLAYGVQKRIDIARALAGSPKVLLLDEPTSGTITSERVEVSEAIQLVTDVGVPTILVDHDVDFVSRHCSRVLVMSYGKPVGVGPTEEMLARPDVIETFLGAVTESSVENAEDAG
jgi:branched-chain amino acid transport system ATP-binding protein